MSYVLNKVLNIDVVDIINKQVVSDTIETLKERVKVYQALFDTMVEKFNTVQKLWMLQIERNDLLKDKYEISIETIYNNLTYGDGEGLIYNISYMGSFDMGTYEDFEEWYDASKDNYLKWVISTNCENYKDTIPGSWVYDVMKIKKQKEKDGTYYTSDKDNYETFLEFVLYIKLKEHLNKNDNKFKNKMSELYMDLCQTFLSLEYSDSDNESD